MVEIWNTDRFHDDANLRAKAEEKLKRINLAYERLSNAPTRNTVPKVAGPSVPVPVRANVARAGVHLPKADVRPIATGGSMRTSPKADQDKASRLIRRLWLASGIVAFLIVAVLILGKKEDHTSEAAKSLQSRVADEPRASEKPPPRSTEVPPETPEPIPAKLDLRTIAARARAAVGLILGYDGNGDKKATGSGFFIADTGLLVTNYHVIRMGDGAAVKTDTGGLFKVKGAIGIDAENDLALLVIEGKGFPFLPLGTAEKVDAGDRISIIGSPLGLEGSLSEGIVAAKRKLFGGHDWLQITAAISPGSSGSPVLDSSGNVIGVATMLLKGGQSLNFAVPVSAVGHDLQARARHGPGKRRHRAGGSAPRRRGGQR